MTNHRQTRRAVAAAAALGTMSAGLVLAAPADAATTAHFVLGKGVLTIIGDGKNNTIDVSRDAAGAIKVNGGAVRIEGANPTISNVRLIKVLGRGGDDAITIDEANGALPAAQLLGGSGNDTLIGGSGNDQLSGGAGSDVILGKGGIDNLDGGSGNDTLTGGVGDDQVFGGAGDDRMVWNPGEGSDLNEGEAGSDSVVVNGGNGAEAFIATANGTRVRFDRINPAPFSIDIGTSENLFLNANGGDDTFSTSGNLAPLIHVTADGGTGNDTLAGGTGNDTLIGGDGNDFVDGNGGSDLALLGAGDDTFQWDPGDGSDTVEGQAGQDAMLFNGSNVGENMVASANGTRVRFTRDVGGIVMDLDGIERIDTNALGGADTITANDLSGTGLTALNVNLAGSIGGSAGDALADNVVVNGTNGADAVTVAGSQSAGVTVTGLQPAVTITGTDGTTDTLTVNGLAGDDAIEGSGLAADGISFIANGGDGADVVIGGAGNDKLFGNAGDDILIGGPGQDLLDGGTGSNVLIQ